jgi:hypothetical protein
MKLSNPSVESLKAMISLEEKRLALQKEIDAIQQQLSSLQARFFGNAATAVKAAVASLPTIKLGRRKRAKRGALSEGILSALHAAGDAGVRVKDLAVALGSKAANVHSWFQSTAKRHPIRKISAGVYKLTGKLTSEPAKSSKAPKAKGKAGRPAKKGATGKRGALAAKVLAALEGAGSEGISVKDISAKTGAHYKNISIWFATTGKKNSKIRKVGPARYKLSA